MNRYNKPDQNIVKHITVPGLQHENLENHCCQTTEWKCGKGKLYTAQCDTICKVLRLTPHATRTRAKKNKELWGLGVEKIRKIYVIPLELVLS